MSDESWIQNLPISHMAYPDSWWNRIKYGIWHLYSPYHAHMRDFLLGCHLIYHTVERQDFLMGTLALNISPKAFAEHLIAHGFANHFVAWKDKGEILSLRRVDGFKRQYHIRLFDDGEVRTHYEYTPEYRPIAHLLEKDIEPRREEFMEVLCDTIVPL